MNSFFKEQRKNPIFKYSLIFFSYVLVVVISIGSFIFLTNMGIIKFNVINTNEKDALFDINNITEVTKNVSSTNVSVDALTPQEVASKVQPSVVGIQMYSTRSPQIVGEGSGIIATSDGYIITNEHVVVDNATIKVILYNGKTYEGKLIGKDPLTDLALIKIEASGLTEATFGNSAQVNVADMVIAIGNPGGSELSNTVTIGYISATNRMIENESGYEMNCLQTDAAINPGNSGGALVNMYGQVIGINSSKIVATGYEGLGFAIAINDAQSIITDIKNYGYVKNRASFDFDYQYIDSMTSRFYRLPVGLYITESSNKAIKEGDVITKINDAEISDEKDVTNLLMEHKPNDKISITLYRDGAYHNLDISLVESK